MTDKATLKDNIRRRLRGAGFDVVGFASAARVADRSDALRAFVDAGYHGDMHWLADRLAVRGHPNNMWSEVRTVIAAAMNYGPAGDPLKLLNDKRRGAVSVYARGTDYHDILKKRLKQVARWLARETGTELKLFVDTAPVMEKPLAEAAGLGWQGKHTNLVSRDWGSWLFLGIMYTPLELEPDAAETDHCGSCRNCLDICPTGAFPAPYRIDARKCISYLTIEHKGHIPKALRAPMGNRIYGCDDCLAVCPWNKYARAAREAAFLPRRELQAPLLAELAALTDADFRSVFAGSAIKRVGRDRFLRNVLIAIGNAGDAADDILRARARQRLDDASPLVRAMAVWACSRLLAAHEFHRLRSKFLPQEPDPAVRAEWSCDETTGI